MWISYSAVSKADVQIDNKRSFHFSTTEQHSHQTHQKLLFCIAGVIFEGRKFARHVDTKGFRSKVVQLNGLLEVVAITVVTRAVPSIPFTRIWSEKGHERKNHATEHTSATETDC